MALGSSTIKLLLTLLAVLAILVLAFDTYIAVTFERMYCPGHDLLRTLLTDMPAGHC
jgi:hypothetical protein